MSDGDTPVPLRIDSDDFLEKHVLMYDTQRKQHE